jgi:hypothetical protein
VKPPVCDFCLSAANRLWLFDVDTGRAYFSDVNKIEKFSADSYTSDFDMLDGDEITGVALLKNSILVFKRNKTFSIDLYGDAFPVSIIDSDEGCINYRTIAVDMDSGFAIYLSSSGVKLINEAGEKIDLTLNKLWRTDMFPQVAALSDPKYCFGHYSIASGCYHLYFNVAGAPENSVHYVCSLRESGQSSGAWSKFDHLYSNELDSEGLKFYSFGILTDNAGLPFLCAPTNITSDSDTVRLFQIDVIPSVLSITGWVLITSSASIVEDPISIYRGSTFPSGSEDNAIYLGIGQIKGSVGIYRLPEITRIGKSNASTVFDIADHYVEFSIDTSWDICTEPTKYYTYGNYFYFSAEVKNTNTLVERIVLGRISRSDYSAETVASIPVGAVEWSSISYELDLDYFVDELGYSYDSDTGILTWESGGIEYGALVGDKFDDEELISGQDRAFLGPLPYSQDWCVYEWSNPS